MKNKTKTTGQRKIKYPNKKDKTKGRVWLLLCIFHNFKSTWKDSGNPGGGPNFPVTPDGTLRAYRIIVETR
jgi:hypothetical protein